VHKLTWANTEMCGHSLQTNLAKTSYIYKEVMQIRRFRC